jgi:multisubunit Na+/H+ antiporter MnhB subunit
MWEGIRRCNVAAIILVAVAIVAGALTDIVPATTWEPIADTFKDVVLFLSGCAAWVAHALANIRLMLFGMLGLLLLFYVLTRPQADEY